MDRCGPGSVAASGTGWSRSISSTYVFLVRSPREHPELVDERRARIHDDLRGIFSGELRFEPLERAPYAIDASLFEVDPLGVVVPRTEDDVVSLVRYAAENQIPLHPRGAGTGSGGGAIGHGLIVDFSRYFHRVVEVLPEHVVVQPGVVLDGLNARLAPLGRRVGPDPPGSSVSTLGGHGRG